jgi:hypothetical protein
MRREPDNSYIPKEVNVKSKKLQLHSRIAAGIVESETVKDVVKGESRCPSPPQLKQHTERPVGRTPDALLLLGAGGRKAHRLRAMRPFVSCSATTTGTATWERVRV